MKDKPAKRPIYKVRIVYKSGYVHDAEFYSFSFKDGGWTTEPVDAAFQPVMLGVDEFAAIWQMGIREG